MSKEVFQMVEELNQEDLQTQLALQCAPLLTGIKVSNLLSVKNQSEEDIFEMFRETRISVKLIYQSEEKRIYLLYQREELEAYLNTEEVAETMKMFGYEELAQRFSIDTLHAMYNEVNNRINLVNLKENLQNSEDVPGLLNMALDQVEFHFRKVSEDEMVIADKFQDILEKTRRELERSLDPKDPEYISLLEELKRIFKKNNIEELTADEMKANIDELERIRKAAVQQNLRDQMLCAKYGNDAKFMRTHKRLKETPPPIGSDPVIFGILMGVKTEVDQKVLKNQHMMDNHAYFTQEIMPTIIQSCRTHGVQPTLDQVRYIDTCISDEYFAERTWTA